MEKINCIICGNKIKAPDPNIDLDNYNGQVFCHECKVLLYIKTVSGKVIKYNIVSKQTVNVKVDHKVEVITAVPRPDYSQK